MHIAHFNTQEQARKAFRKLRSLGCRRVARVSRSGDGRINIRDLFRLCFGEPGRLTRTVLVICGVSFLQSPAGIFRGNFSCFIIKVSIEDPFVVSDGQLAQ